MAYELPVSDTDGFTMLASSGQADSSREERKSHMAERVVVSTFIRLMEQEKRIMARMGLEFG